MTNEGLNKARVRAGDIKNIGSFITSNSYKPAIRGEAAVLSTTIGHLEFSHYCSRIRVLDFENSLMA
jgi:hypothetical protein